MVVSLKAHIQSDSLLQLVLLADQYTDYMQLKVDKRQAVPQIKGLGYFIQIQHATSKVDIAFGEDHRMPD